MFKPRGHEYHSEGHPLKKEIREFGLKQYELADMMKISPSKLSMYLNGKKSMPDDVQQELEVAMEKLTYGEFESTITYLYESFESKPSSPELKLKVPLDFLPVSRR
jgi:transcriptional regulator with XRE-family HTH domain